MEEEDRRPTSYGRQRARLLNAYHKCGSQIRIQPGRSVLDIFRIGLTSAGAVLAGNSCNCVSALTRQRAMVSTDRINGSVTGKTKMNADEAPHQRYRIMPLWLFATRLEPFRRTSKQPSQRYIGRPSARLLDRADRQAEPRGFFQPTGYGVS